ncbi:MAG: hypothetical protein OEV40_12710 [Acidimicrobiia bacterium]|nr:hypothetical protein [Acidimicrobiia bacterium]
MGFLDSLKAWLRTETADLKDAKGDLESRLDDDLTRRERLLEETPTDAMERLQEEIADGQSAFDTLEDKIGHAQARADAVADLGAEETAAGDLSDDDPADILDLDPEEIE